jgi:hypothetical protein
MDSRAAGTSMLGSSPLCPVRLKRYPSVQLAGRVEGSWLLAAAEHCFLELS